MTRRRFTAAGLAPAGLVPAGVLAGVLAGLLTGQLAAAGAASAGGPGGSTSSTAGCNGGGSCWNGLSKYLSVSGPSGYHSSSGGNAGVSMADVPPPACWEQYFNTGPGAYRWWKGYTNSGDPNVAAGVGGSGYGQQFYRHRSDPPSTGTWYTAVENPSGPAGGAQCVANLPEFQWVAAGATPPLPQIPARDLAMYALSTLHLPAPAFDLSPGRRSYVTLPTFVTKLQGDPAGPITLVARFGNEVAPPVTVTANAVTISTPNAEQYDNCGPDGTRDSQAQMDKAGPHTNPDCGVVYQGPSTGYGTRGYPVTVSVSWTATFQGHPIGPDPIQMTSQAHYIPVAEIQSVNNASG